MKDLVMRRLPGRISINSHISLKGKSGLCIGSDQKGNITMKTEMAVMQPQTKEFWWPGEAGKDREQILFWSFQREHITHTSSLVQWH